MVSRRDASGAARVQRVAQGHINNRYVRTLTLLLLGCPAALT